MNIPSVRNMGKPSGGKDHRDCAVLTPGAPTSTPADTQPNKGMQYETGSGKPAGPNGGENSGR